MFAAAGINRDLSRVFRAQQLATLLADATVVNVTAEPARAHEDLTAARFDQAPVRDGRHIVGWVRTADLARAKKVEPVMHPLGRSAIVSLDAPLEQLLGLLSRHQLVFLAGYGGLEAFVTPSDLDRHAARAHFYLLISGIEMLLSELVAQRYDDATLESHIDSSTRPAWQRARKNNTETNPVEYLHLEKLASLLRGAMAGDERWTKQVDDQLSALCQFRPTVMHPTRPLLSGRRTAAQIAQLADYAATVTDALLVLEFDGAADQPPPG